MRRLAPFVLAVAVCVPAIAEEPAEEPVLGPVDARVLEEFKLLADTNATDAKTTWQRLVGSFIREPVAQRRQGRKFLFRGTKVEAPPTDFFADVRRTTSLIYPYEGVIEYAVVFLTATSWVRGEREFCDAKPLALCLEHGGELFETDVIYKSETKRTPKKIRIEFRYQDGKWRPKATLDEALDRLAQELDYIQPAIPATAPSILGIPRPAAPATPPPDPPQ